MKLKRLFGQAGYPYFPYNYRHELIYIHVPKCGGTSILAELNNGAKLPRYHADWRAYRQADPQAFERFFKFAIVRDPASRLRSAYQYLQAGGNKRDDQWISELITREYRDFEHFVLQYLDRYTVHEHLMFKPQYLFFYDGTAHCKVDQVIHYENFTQQVLELFQRLGLQQDSIRHSNRSTAPNTATDQLSPEVIKHIENLYRRDYELLGYGVT